MDIIEFQEKLGALCETAEKNNRVLTAEQMRTHFQGMELEKAQLLKILQYLKMKGISLEGLADGTSGGTADSETADRESSGESRTEEKGEPLTPGEETYLKGYLEELGQDVGDGRTAAELFHELSEGDALAYAALLKRYMPAAAHAAAEMNSRDIALADLIQEANMGLLMALGEAQEAERDDAWLINRIRQAVREAVQEQSDRKFQDDCLVAKVRNLEAAMKGLAEDGDEEEIKFTVDELAVILDMEVEEIRDVLRLTGDDKS